MLRKGQKLVAERKLGGSEHGTTDETTVAERKFGGNEHGSSDESTGTL